MCTLWYSLGRAHAYGDGQTMGLVLACIHLVVRRFNFFAPENRVMFLLCPLFSSDFWNNSDTESEIDLQLSTGGFDQEDDDDDFDFYG